MPRKTSLKTLQAQIRVLEAKAEKLQYAEKPGMKQLRAVVAKFKLKPADIKVAFGKSAKRGLALGTKLKPKYQNPKNKDETWAGRGLRPKWLTAMVKSGKKLEDFVV